MPSQFSIPLTAFLKVIKGTPDEVWGGLLRIKHGAEKHTEADWRSLIGQYRNRPVTYNK